MLIPMRASKAQCLGFLLFLIGILQCKALARYTFVVSSTECYTDISTLSYACKHWLDCIAQVRKILQVQEMPCKRLCSTKNILTVNGQFPGPTLYVHKGDTITVDVYNKAKYNITIHCDWSRATVHGAIVIYPKKDSNYPFPKPDAEVPIILGEWWKKLIMEVYHEMLRTRGDLNVSDAYTINGQPGDLYPCSKQDTFKLRVEQGKTYLLRIINAAMQDLFFSIANHSLTVVATDASNTKPLTRDIVTISPGQTIDVRLKANQNADHYYMAARVYSSALGVACDNTTTTAVYAPTSPTPLPQLPYYNDTSASVNFIGSLRSLASDKHPIDVPKNITNHFIFTISVNSFLCPNNSCAGPNGTRLAASMNNISFTNPSIDILQAYYYGINGVSEPSSPASYHTSSISRLMTCC
ncbi:hypothetical protein EUGRSUZ_J03170 [Eucalyptus grandis]|uniref:Uncharacterized protein n=2 Tax=Eucalyptus grandis TaxID=71139 RepID=A0ACC3JBY2_EUCGR|nr:hypothetical protein EUGRSUZ_J03170 [Eucalyptus grandis]